MKDYNVYCPATYPSTMAAVAVSGESSADVTGANEIEQEENSHIYK